MCATHILMYLEHIPTTSSPCKTQEANEILGLPRFHPRVIGTVNNCWGEQTLFGRAVWSRLQEACSFGELSPHTGLGFLLMELTLRHFIVLEPTAGYCIQEQRRGQRQQIVAAEGRGFA